MRSASDFGQNGELQLLVPSTDMPANVNDVNNKQRFLQLNTAIVLAASSPNTRVPSVIGPLIEDLVPTVLMSSQMMLSFITYTVAALTLLKSVVHRLILVVGEGAPYSAIGFE